MVRVPTDISEGGISDYKSDYVVREIEIPPVKTRGKSTSWRLGVITCLVKTGVVGVLFVFSDYKSDYSNPF
jgi:hypothetical protein